MIDPIREVKTRAELLHKRAAEGDARALTRLAALPELRRATDDERRRFVETLQRKHCLAVVSRELGFSSWEHAKRLLEGSLDEEDFGTTLYGIGCAPMLNHWATRYEEAREIHANVGGYLLAYKRHYCVVQAGYVEAVELDPADADWDAIGRDWPRPRDVAARTRLYGKLISCRAA